MLERQVKMKVISVIPARYASTRFPGKPLASICGKPMIWWVYNAISQMPEISKTYVATDDLRIYDAVKSFNGNAVVTCECNCGTDRVAEVCRDMSFDIVLNIQGDEPMVRTEHIKALINAFNDTTVQMATLRKKIEEEKEINDPNIAKVIVNSSEDAIYFSRNAIPCNRDNIEVVYYKHIGLYAFKRDFLYKFVSLPQSNLEKAESLEQLRAIENGYNIRTVETAFQSIGVDLPEHINAVEKEIMNIRRNNL